MAFNVVLFVSTVGIFATDETSDITFKGFLASVFYNGEHIGQMKPGRKADNNPATAMVKTQCDKTSLTHENNEAKAEIFFEWKAPMDLSLDAIVELR